MRNALKAIEEKTVIVTIFFSACGFFLTAFADTVVEQWLENKITTSVAGAMFFMAIVVALLGVISAASLELMKQLNRKVAIKVRYYERDDSGEVYVACQKVVSRATTSLDVMNSYLIEGDEAARSFREKTERKKYYSALIDRACNHGVRYRRIVQVREDRSNLMQMGDDPLHEAHLREMLTRARGNAAVEMLLVECKPSRITTFVLVDGEHLIWQINEVRFDANGKERLSLQGAFIFHDPQRRITPQFIKYFNKMLHAHQGPLRLA